MNKVIDTTKETLKAKFPRAKEHAVKRDDGWHIVYLDGAVGEEAFPTKAEAEENILFYLNSVFSEFWVNRPEIISAVKTYFQYKKNFALASELEHLIMLYLVESEDEIFYSAVDYLIWLFAEHGEVVRD